MSDKKPRGPITFEEPSYLLMRDGMAMMSPAGHLAIFNVERVAKEVAKLNARVQHTNITVQPISIKPVGQAHPSNVLNPETAILQQLDSHWQQVAALLVWKLAKDGVSLTQEEINSFPLDKVLLTHGHKDSIEFKLVTQEAAEAIVKYDRSQAGHA